MRVIRDLLLIGVVATAGRWLFANRGEAADWLVAAVAVATGALAAYLAVRFLIWFGRGFARGFRSALDRQSGADEVREREVATRRG
jgi:hypothetical protein